MSAALVKTLLLVWIAGVSCWADPITVGLLIYLNPITTGFQGFEVYDQTGSTYGCTAAGGAPVCDALNLDNPLLTVTFSDGSTATETPSGGFAFAPGIYIYGDNAGDDLSQSFMFDPTDPNPAEPSTPLTIVSATFTGTLSSADFQITDDTNQFPFISDGTFSASLSIPDQSSFASANIVTNQEQQGVVPEPGTLLLLTTCLALPPLRRHNRFMRK